MLWLHCCFVVCCSGPKCGVLWYPLPQGLVPSSSPKGYFSAARRIWMSMGISLWKVSLGKVQITILRARSTSSGVSRFFCMDNKHYLLGETLLGGAGWAEVLVAVFPAAPPCSAAPAPLLCPCSPPQFCDLLLVMPGCCLAHPVILSSSAVWCYFIDCITHFLIKFCNETISHLDLPPVAPTVMLTTFVALAGKELWGV